MLSRYQGPDRLIAVSDRLVNGLTVKQKVEIGDILVGRESIVCPLTVRQYAQAADGGYGEAYPATFIAPYRKSIYANNLTAVRADDSLAYTLRRGRTMLRYADGQEVEAPALEGKSDQACFEAFLAAEPETYYLQGQRFAQMQDVAPVALWPLAVHHVQQADALGYFS